MDKEIIEGNKLIAEFENRVFEDCYFVYQNAIPYTFATGYKISSNWRNRRVEVNNLQYHSSWDWLMPAIKKFKSELDSTNELHITEVKKINFHLTMINIETTFLQFVESLKWYNQNKQQ